MNQLPTTTALLLLLLTGCNSTTQQQSQASKDSLYAKSVVISAPPADSLSLDLPTLKAQGKLTDVQTVRVADDPVFHSAKTYRSIPLRQVLERYTSLKNLDVAFRHDCKMPAVTYLSDKELDEIMRYLTFMATHKTQPQPSNNPAPSA